MILKILTRHDASYASLIRYIQKGSRDGTLITHNLRSTDVEGYTQEFLENQANRKHQRKGQIYLYHEIISLSSKEDSEMITDEMLNDLARQYIKLRGDTGVFIGAIHRNTASAHLHLMSGGTEYKTGLAFRLSRAELQNLKLNFQEYQKNTYPQLTHSLPRHGRGVGHVTDREFQASTRDKRALVKGEIQAVVLECFGKATTRKMFLELLRDNDLHHYERRGVPIGIICEKMKIRFSRLGISQEQLLAKVPDRIAEMEALTEIQRLRKAAKDHSRERNI